MRYLILLLCLSACARFPALEGTISDTASSAPYPRLTALPDMPPASAPDSDTDLALRVAALKQRAARLREIDIAALQ